MSYNDYVFNSANEVNSVDYYVLRDGKYEKYLRKGKIPEHHGWSWIIIILIITVIAILIYFYSTIRSENNISPDDSIGQYGTYSDPIIGTCNGTNICANPGVKTITRECIPNQNTGLGCIIPEGPNQGLQSYETLLRIEECSPHCVVSKWQIINEDQPCVVSNNGEIINTDICVPKGKMGSRDIKFQCVNNDSIGSNECTAYVKTGDTQDNSISISGASIDNSALLPFGSSRITATNNNEAQYVLRTYQIGDMIDVKLNCNDYVNPICGNWSFVTPVPPNYPVSINANQVSICTLGDDLLPNQNCIVSGIYDTNIQNASTSYQIWNYLREGYDVNSLSCVYEDNGGLMAITPSINDPPSNNCNILKPPDCLAQQINSNMIINGNLPTDNTGEVLNTVCSNSTLYNSNNPSCYQLCRLVDSSPELTNKYISATDSYIGQILDKYISIRWPIGNIYKYLTLRHVPCSKPIKTQFGSCPGMSNNIDSKLLDVQTIAISNQTNKFGCNSSQTEFQTSLLMMIGPRSYNNNKSAGLSGIVTGQILSLATSQYLGWISYKEINEGHTLIWSQAYNIYNGFGISSKAAPNFNVQVTSEFDNTPPEGFPSGTLGTIGLSITDSNGGEIIIATDDGDTLSMDKIEAIIYDPNVIDIQSKDGLCNLLL